jgi:molecular chaperone GrpE (heat shock protein)
MREPSSQYPAETVMEELEKGYLIGSQVLKAAMVKVSSGPQPVAERTQS